VNTSSNGYARVLPATALDGVATAVDRTPDPPEAGPVGQEGARSWDIPFVGRAAELRRLRTAFEAARRGQGRAVLLVGDHGIGKTRLADELAREAADAGAEILVGHCYEGAGAPSFWPWIQMLRSYAERRDAGTLAAEIGVGATHVAAVVPDLRAHLPELPALAPASPEEASFGFLDAVCRALVRAARVRPLVLVLDDLHAADPPSLLLLEFLASRLAHARILVVGSLREDGLAAGQGLLKTITELLRSGVLERLDLDGFSASDVRALIERLAPRAPSPALAQAVVTRTEGVPSYVVEVVRALLAGGVFGKQPTAGKAKLRGSDGGVHVPPNVRLAVACRLKTLPPAARELLALAASFGREFRFEGLMRAAELEPPAILDLLGQAIAARILTELPEQPGHYRFTHALLVEALVAGWGSSAARRPALNRRGIDALVAGPRAEDVPPEVTGRAEVVEPAAMSCVMRCEGEYWLVAFDGRADRFRHSLGFRYLAELLWHAGSPVRATELAAAGRATAPSRRRDPDVTVRADLGDAGIIIDARARADYKRRLAELAAELEDAERSSDIGRIPVVKREIDALTEQLASVARGHRIASHAERARVAVTKGLSSAIDRIAQRHPALGEHLRVTVKRGYSCTYSPDPRVSIRWES
jgi:hypothetical protein